MSLENTEHETAILMSKLILTGSQILFGSRYPTVNKSVLVLIACWLIQTGWHHPPYQGDVFQDHKAPANRACVVLDIILLWTFLCTIFVADITGMVIMMAAALPASMFIERCYIKFRTYKKQQDEAIRFRNLSKLFYKTRHKSERNLLSLGSH